MLKTIFATELLLDGLKLYCTHCHSWQLRPIKLMTRTESISMINMCKFSILNIILNTIFKHFKHNSAAACETTQRYIQTYIQTYRQTDRLRQMHYRVRNDSYSLTDVAFFERRPDFVIRSFLKRVQVVSVATTLALISVVCPDDSKLMFCN